MTDEQQAELKFFDEMSASHATTFAERYIAAGTIAIKNIAALTAANKRVEELEKDKKVWELSRGWDAERKNAIAEIIRERAAKICDDAGCPECATAIRKMEIP